VCFARPPFDGDKSPAKSAAKSAHSKVAVRFAALRILIAWRGRRSEGERFAPTLFNRAVQRVRG
jgi:hypothetical protein